MNIENLILEIEAEREEVITQMNAFYLRWCTAYLEKRLIEYYERGTVKSDEELSVLAQNFTKFKANTFLVISRWYDITYPFSKVKNNEALGDSPKDFYEMIQSIFKFFVLASELNEFFKNNKIAFYRSLDDIDEWYLSPLDNPKIETTLRILLKTHFGNLEKFKTYFENERANQKQLDQNSYLSKFRQVVQ